MGGRLKLIVKKHDMKFDEWGIKKGMLCKQSFKYEDHWNIATKTALKNDVYEFFNWS